MGLLDTMDDPQFRLGMGLLAAGSARSDGAGVGQRLNEVLGSMDQWKQQQAAQKRAALQEQLYNAQLQEMTQKTARERQLLEQERAKREALPNLFQSGNTQGSVSFNQPFGFDMISQGAKVDVPAMAGPARLNVQAALKAGYTPEEIQKLDALRNIGRNKVARTVKGIGPDGKEYEYQLDENGDRVGDNFAQWKAPIFNEGGGQTNVIDPYNPLKPLGSIPKTMTFGDKTAAGNLAVSQANANLAERRFRFEQAGGADAGKPKLVDGQWVMAPTGMTPGQTLPAVAPVSKKDAVEALALIQSAREVIPKSTGSYLGAGVDQFTRLFGQSTSGDDAAAQLKAMEGALVSKMPKMSGPQSDKDVALYKQMAGEIGDPTIPNDRKLAALKSIEEIQNRYAGITQPAKPTNAPMRGQVVDGYKFKGGDPANPSSWEKQ